MATPWRQRIIELRALGVGYNDIAERSGLAYSSVAGIAGPRAAVPTGDPAVRLYLLHQEVTRDHGSLVPMIELLPQAPVRRAIAILGGRAELAQLVNDSLTRAAQWARGLPMPPEYCPAVERATGVPCEELRPDLCWERNDAGAVTGYRARLAPSVPASAEAA